jgi:hypothetical protein
MSDEAASRSEATTPLTDHNKGEDNIGMAMTFTLVSHLRERLSKLLRQRIENRKREERERERRELEVRISLSGPTCIPIAYAVLRLRKRVHEALQ